MEYIYKILLKKKWILLAIQSLIVASTLLISIYQSQEKLGLVAYIFGGMFIGACLVFIARYYNRQEILSVKLMLIDIFSIVIFFGLAILFVIGLGYESTINGLIIFFYITGNCIRIATKEEI